MNVKELNDTLSLRAAERIAVITGLLFLTGCVPKFHYQDCVVIEDNFYGPTFGVVTQFSPPFYYTVTRRLGAEQHDWFTHESLMTKVDKTRCDQ